MKPFVKWVGGKTKLLPVLKEKLPKQINRYVEPFVGGGALFLSLTIPSENVILGDINARLMHTWKVIQESPQELIAQLNEYEETFNNLKTNEERSNFYYNTRAELNSSDNYDVKYAAQFIFLNKTGFNGLYREGRTGNINVAFGYKQQISLMVSEDNMYTISKALGGNEPTKKSIILCGDFEDTCNFYDLHNDDFVFFDSPYVKQYTGYTYDGFKEEDHIRLSNLFKRLSDKGVNCMLTNNNCDYVKDLYKDFYITEIGIEHTIGGKGNRRQGSSEVIITNY